MLLTGWKSIANQLQCGVRSAQRWETEFALPVRRPAGGDRHLVFAFSEELDEWVRRMQPGESKGVEPSIMRQAELRRELAELRARQRQLISELRSHIQQARTSARSDSSPRNQSFDQSTPDRLREARPLAPVYSMSMRGVPVLAVDDNESQCYAISRILRQAGFKVFEAHTGSHALEIALNEPLQLALLDIHLPDFSGYELFALLRREPRTRTMPILFHTATAPEYAADYIIDTLKADGLIRNPIEPGLLVSLVQGAIQKNKALVS